MAYNGSGVFSRLYSWATDKANNIVVTASRMDDEMNGFADGLTNAICRDGQTTITANIPFNSKKITGLADGTAATDSINVGQVQNNAFGYWGTTGGAADAYTLAPAPTITAYATTQNFTAKIHATNTTTTPYLQISGIANPASTAVIKKLNLLGAESQMQNGDMVAGKIYNFQRNSTNDAWICLNPESQANFNTNALINGAFNIWQRGTSFAAAADATYTADRWRYGKSGAMIHTISRSTDVPSASQIGRVANYSALISCTTIDNSIISTDFCNFEQRIEGFNFALIAQTTITLSFWVKATKTGIYCVALRNNITGTPDRSCVKEYTINTTNTWEYKTLTFPASPSAGTWNYTNGGGLGISWCLVGGSTYQGIADSWQTGNLLCTSNQVNACDSTSNNFQLCGTQLEKGSVSTPFQNMLASQELAMCFRYLEMIGGQLTNEQICTGSSVSPTLANGIVRFLVEKRAIPTISMPSGSHFRFNNGSNNYISTATSANNVSTKAFLLGLTISGASANTGGVIDTYATTGIITIESEL